MGPAVSWLWPMGIMRARETSPSVGFSPATPFMALGQTIDPSVSAPTAPAASPAATPAALPALEPQALRSRT